MPYRSPSGFQILFVILVAHMGYNRKLVVRPVLVISSVGS